MYINPTANTESHEDPVLPYRNSLAQGSSLTALPPSFLRILRAIRMFRALVIEGQGPELGHERAHS